METPEALACFCTRPDAALPALPASLAWIADNMGGAPAAPDHGADA